MKVLLTDPVPLPLFEQLRVMLPAEVDFDMVLTAAEADFAAHAAEADVLLVVLRRIDARTLALAPRVRFIQRLGIGYDNIDVAAVRQAGALAAYTPGANSGAVAEHTILLMLALLKRFVAAEQGTRAGGWPAGEVAQAGIGDLAGATVGLVGLGSIGQAVAQRLAPFGATLLYTTRRQQDAATEERLGVGYVSLPELLAASNVVSLHLPVTDETRGLIGDDQLAMMRPGAFLVNVSRGELIDEAALRRAIERRHLGGAALDVLQREGPGGNPFADLPQVIVTPHVAGVSRAGLGQIMRMAMTNVARFLAGEPPLHPLPGLEDASAAPERRA
jgi:phosphoglycerate dehydrogenase-like enzyme